MRREEYSVNPTMEGFRQEKDYALHVIKLQKAKTVINTTPFEPPLHLKVQLEYNQKFRKDMLEQSEYIRSLIPTKENPQPHPPKARNFNEIFHYKKKHINKSPKKQKNGRQDSQLPPEFFLTQNQNQKLMTPPQKNRPLNYYDFDKESYSPTGESILSIQSDTTEDDNNNIYQSPLTKTQLKRHKEVLRRFNSRFYKPERLKATNKNSIDDISLTNDEENKSLQNQNDLNSNENLTGIEVDDNEFDENLFIKNNYNNNNLDLTPKLEKSKNSNINDKDMNESPNNHLTEKKDDSISEAFVSNANSPANNKIQSNQNLAQLNSSNNISQTNSTEKKIIRVKRKKIIRKRISKSKINSNENEQQEDDEEDNEKNSCLTYAKTTNGKPYQILFLKPNDPIPLNSAIVQMDMTRIVVVRSPSPLETVEVEKSSNFELPNNSIFILPNQKNLLKKFSVKKTNVSLPTFSSFVIIPIDDKPLHFIYINPDCEVPPNAFLVHRDNRIRIAVQGQLKISQIKLGDPLPPNSIRTPSFINQPRRTVCIASHDKEQLNFITVRKGEEHKLPRNSIIVHSDKFTKTAVVSQSLQPLEYFSVFEGGKFPQNSIVLSSNVIKKKPPKMAIIPSKEANEENESFSFITVKNSDELQMNSIIAQSDHQNILAIVPFDASQKICPVLIEEGQNWPNGAICVDLSSEKLVPNIVAVSDDPLNISTFTNIDEIPKNSIVLKKDDKTAVALVSQSNQPLHASTKDDLQVSSNSFIIESCVSSSNNKNKNRVTAVSPDNQPLNLITLKSIKDLPLNSLVIKTENDDSSKRVMAVVASNEQPLQLMNTSNIDDKEFLSKLSQNSFFVSVDENDKDKKVTNNIRIAVKSPDDRKLNVISVTNDDDIPQNAAIIKSDQKTITAIVAPDNQPLQLVTLKNGEQPPENSYVLPKSDSSNDNPDPSNDNEHLSSENKYIFRLAATSYNGEPLNVLTLNEKEEIPPNSIVIQSGDFGNVIAVSQDNNEINLITVREGEKIPTNSIEIKSNEESQAKLCVVSPDNEPLQFITLKHGDELPKNSFVIESDEDKIVAVTSDIPIQILSVNENEEVPKNAILINENSQRFAFTSPNGEPLNILTIKSDEEIPLNSKIIKGDDKTSLIITSPMNQPLLISTLKEGENAPKNSYVYDPKDQNESKIAIVSPSKDQMNIVTLKPGDDLPHNSVLIKSDKNSSVAISSPNSKPLRCISLNKGDEAPPNSFVFDEKMSLFVPFASLKPKESSNFNYEHHTDELNDNDYNDESDSEDNNENHSKFEFLIEIPEILTNDTNNNATKKVDNSPRIIVEANNKEPLKYITLNESEEIPKNSIVVSQGDKTVCIVSNSESPLKFVDPTSFDNDRENHENAVDITQPNLLVVSSPNNKKLNVITVKKGEKLPKDSAIISQDDNKTVVVVGDPTLDVTCLKPNQNPEELPPNSIQPLIQTNNGNEDENLQSSSAKKIDSNDFKIAVIASPENPLSLVTLNINDPIPPNSIVIESDQEKVVYAVSPTKDPLECEIIRKNDPIPNNSIIAFDGQTKESTRVAIYTENRKQFQYLTLSENSEIPSNSFIIHSDKYYKEIIKSSTNSPLLFHVLNEEEVPSEVNTFVGIINNLDMPAKYNAAVATSDNSPLLISVVKDGQKIQKNSVIALRKGNRIFTLGPESDAKPLLLYINNTNVPENCFFLNSIDAASYAISSKDGKPLNYTIVKSDNENDNSFPKESFIIDTEGGSNPRSLAVVTSDSQKLIYHSMNNEKQINKLPKNSVVITKNHQSEDDVRFVVKSQDGKALKFLTINKNEELPENGVVIHKETNGRKVVVQATNRKPLQYLILDKNDELPKNSIQISNDEKPIERIVVMSSSFTNNANKNKNAVSSDEKIFEPLQYVILNRNEEVPLNSAVIKREGGKNPRRLAVKSPTGHSLKYLPIHYGEDIPTNSVTFCRLPSSIDCYKNSNFNDDEIGVFNNTNKTCIAATSADIEKPFQYIIAKFGDRLPKNMVSIFREGGEDPRTVAINSVDENSSPLRFFFVNPGCKLPSNSIFIDESEVRKSITVTPGPSADPLLDVEEIGIDEPIPENAIVVSTIKKNGKLVRIIVKSSDNSPLIPSLALPGFEPRNAFIINSNFTHNNEIGDDDSKNQNKFIFDQIEQLKLLKEKRARILSGNINSTDFDDFHSSTVTQTNLSAGDFVKEALEKFDLLLTCADDKKGKKKKVTVKRKKKKAIDISIKEIDEEEETIEKTNNSSESSLKKVENDSHSERVFPPYPKIIGPPFTFSENPTDNDDKSNKDDENDKDKKQSTKKEETNTKPSKNQDENECDKTIKTEEAKEKPGVKSTSNQTDENKPICNDPKEDNASTESNLAKVDFQEEEEDNESTEANLEKVDFQEEEEDNESTEANLEKVQIFNTPVSKQQRTPITTLVMDKEMLRKKFIESPVKYDNGANSSTLSGIDHNYSNELLKKQMLIPMLKNSKLDAFSARNKRNKNESKIESSRSFKPLHKNNDNETFNSEQNNNNSNRYIGESIDDHSRDNQNNAEDGYDADDTEFDEYNRPISKKSFTFSSQFEDEMEKNKKKFQNIPFSGMIEMIHIDKDILPSSRSSSKPSPMKGNPTTPNTPETPKTAKIPHRNNNFTNTPNTQNISDKTNSVRFI